MKKLTLSLMALALAGLSTSAMASVSDEGYYGAARLSKVWQKADSMDTSSRPGIGQFAAGDDKDNFYNGSVAAGYQYGNGWRTEAEYTFKKKSEYTSGSTTFPASLNHHKTDSQRLMLNAYRDYEIYQGISCMAPLVSVLLKSNHLAGRVIPRVNTAVIPILIWHILLARASAMSRLIN